jgi:hypothetical protein
MYDQLSLISLSQCYKAFFYVMRLCHPPDGSTSPKYKLLCFTTTNFFCKEKNALAFNRDRCCHLVLCLRFIPFHYIAIGTTSVKIIGKYIACGINYDKKSSIILAIGATYTKLYFLHTLFMSLISYSVCPWQASQAYGDETV